jgi:hypothetical protein
MFKRLSTVLLFGGLLGLVPAAAAEAAPVAPEQTVQTASVPVAGYDLFHKDRDDDHYRCMYHCDGRHRYDRDRHHRHKYCWYRDRWGWYRARCYGYDSHRHHTR